jgi:hypothetical protein
MEQVFVEADAEASGGASVRAVRATWTAVLRAAGLAGCAAEELQDGGDVHSGLPIFSRASRSVRRAHRYLSCRKTRNCCD